MMVLADHLEILLREQKQQNENNAIQAAMGQVLKRLLGETQQDDGTEHTLTTQAKEAADALERLSLQKRIGDNPLDVNDVKKLILDKSASHQYLSDHVRQGIKSDPGLILIELVALVYSTIGFQIRSVTDENLLSMLNLAGIQKRPTRPAGIVLQSKLKIGEIPGSSEPFQLKSAQLPGQTGALPAIESSALIFQPAWKVCGWEIDEGATPGEKIVLEGKDKKNKVRFDWEVTIPSSFFDWDHPEPWIVFVANKVVDADALLSAEWSIVFDSDKDKSYKLRPSYVFFPREEGTFQTPLYWLAFTNSIQGDAEQTPCRAIDRWIRLQFDSPVALPGNKPEKGKLQLFIENKENGKASNDSLKLKANCAIWLNVGPVKDKSESLAFDRQGLWTLPRYQVGGAELNQGTNTKWSSENTKPLGDPKKPDDSDNIFNIITGGQATETTDEMLQRTPAALRYRGSPASSADWEHFLADCDPLDRVAAVAARGTLLPSGDKVTVGVQALLAGVGPPVSGAHLAGWMRDEWITSMAAAVRPLGCSVQLFVPRPMKITYTLKNDTLKNKLTNWADMRISRRGELPLLWVELLIAFRQDGPIRSSKQLLSRVELFLNKQLGAYGLTLSQLIAKSPVDEPALKQADTFEQASLIPICDFKQEEQQ